MAELAAENNPGARTRSVARWARQTWEGGMVEFESMVFDAAQSDPRLQKRWPAALGKQNMRTTKPFGGRSYTRPVMWNTVSAATQRRESLGRPVGFFNTHTLLYSFLSDSYENRLTAHSQERVHEAIHDSDNSRARRCSL